MLVPGVPADASPSDAAASAAPSGEMMAPPPLPFPAADPVSQAAYLQAWASSRVAGPATALIVFGILTIVLQTLAILANVLQIGVVHVAHLGGVQGFAGNADPFQLVGSTIGIVFGAISAVAAIVIVVGGIRMKNLESYRLAVTASILSLIPCFGACCLLGIPLGIWALFILSDNTVRIAFRS
jgi:hypothetical protein